jgi:predicted RNA binding protein YcfA (HicA-like mRNA interferase family)
VKVREAIKILRADGWYLARQTGGHRQYRHPDKPGTVTVSGNLNRDLRAGTLASIWRQARIKLRAL